MKRYLLHLILIICSTFIIGACATVPKESVQLSIELTNMIRSAKSAHLALLDQYVSQRRERINEFMERKWIPKFIENAFKDTKVTELINATKDDKEKETILKEFEEDASVQINKRRSTLIDAVDEIRNKLQEAISIHYDQMLVVNQALTGHLQSAADVTETREKLLSTLNIDPNRLLPMDKINSVMDNILTYESKSQDVLNAIEQVKTLIKEK